MYKSNIYRLKEKDRQLPAIPVFLDLLWRGKSAQISTKKINNKEIWIEIRPFLPPSLSLKRGDKIKGRFSVVTGNGFNEFEGTLEKIEIFALTPNYHFVSLLIIKIKRLPKKALREIEAYKKRLAQHNLYEKTDPLVAIG